MLGAEENSSLQFAKDLHLLSFESPFALIGACFSERSSLAHAKIYSFQDSVHNSYTAGVMLSNRQLHQVVVCADDEKKHAKVIPQVVGVCLATIRIFNVRFCIIN
jgi:hypothetical protein